MDLSIQPYLERAHGAGRPDDGAVTVTLRDCLSANYHRLHRRLAHHLGCSDLASDCLHDAWLRLGEASVPASVHSPEAYVYRVACNVAIDTLRSSRLRQHADDAGLELEHLADPAPGPEAIVAARSAAQAVERALQQLPYRHQSLLMALRVEELSRREVASQFGISLRRVDAMLREVLEHCLGTTTAPATRHLR